MWLLLWSSLCSNLTPSANPFVIYSNGTLLSCPHCVSPILACYYIAFLLPASSLVTAVTLAPSTGPTLCQYMLMKKRDWTAWGARAEGAFWTSGQLLHVAAVPARLAHCSGYEVLWLVEGGVPKRASKGGKKSPGSGVVPVGKTCSLWPSPQPWQHPFFLSPPPTCPGPF